MDQQEEVAALGRPADLGMLYNFRKHQLIIGKTLWSPQELKTNVNTVLNPATKIKILRDENMSEKTLAMGVDGTLKLDILCRNLNVQGAASYLQDEKMSQSETQVVLDYEVKTEFRHLTMEHLKDIKISHPEVLQSVDATHVVVGIQYGGNVFMEFSQKVEKEESSIKVKGEMTLAVEKLKSIISSSGNIDGNSTTDLSEQAKKIKCCVYDDFNTKRYPSNYEEAEQFCKDLPSLTTEGKIGVPLLLFLCPLDSLGISVQQNRRNERKNVSVKLIEKVCRKLEFFQSIIAKCNGLSKEDNWSIRRQLIQFLKAVQKYRDIFREKIRELTNEIRSGSADNSDLESFLEEQESSVFSRCMLNKWIEEKEEKIKQLQGMVENLKDIPFVHNNDLKNSLRNPNITYVVCLVVKTSPIQDVQISNMEAFFKKTPPKISTAQKSEETVSPSNDSRIRAVLKSFMSLYDGNQGNKVVKFVVVEEDLNSVSSSEESGVYLQYYYEGRMLSGDRNNETVLSDDETEESWKNEVRGKLAQVYKDKPERLFKILFFLDEEDKAYEGNIDHHYAPEWQSLKATVKKDEAFLKSAQQLFDEIRKAGKNKRFRKHMKTFHENTISDYSDVTDAIEKYQETDPDRLFYWNTLTSPVAHIARGCAESASKYSITAVDDFVRLVIDKPAGNTVMVGLAVTYLGYKATKEIRRWWRGEISENRLLKNLTDSTLTTAAGVAGGCAVGALLSYAAGPIGILLGSVIAGWASSAGMNFASDWLTQYVLGLPKEEVLENAYRHLGVSMTATNAEVNTAFRKLCLKYHPDKGGNEEKFVALQMQMQIIKEAREDTQRSIDNQIVKKNKNTK